MTDKLLLIFSQGNHELYMRRRQPDPIEVQQMRQEANQRKQEADMIRFWGFLEALNLL